MGGLVFFKDDLSSELRDSHLSLLLPIWKRLGQVCFLVERRAITDDHQADIRGWRDEPGARSFVTCFVYWLAPYLSKNVVPKKKDEGEV